MISIIVPVYNGEKYIDRCLNTILKQDYADVELIFVNDGSTDLTSEKLRKYREEYNWVTVIEQENSGASAARNKGLSVAKGEFITFLDCDDELYQDALRFMFEEMVAHKADLVCCATEFRGEKGSKYEFGTGNSYEFTKNNVREQYLLGDKINISACAKLYKKKLLHGIQFNKNIKIHEDKLFVYEYLLVANRVIVKDVPKYIYHQNEGSAAHGEMHEKWFGVVEVMDRIEKNMTIMSENEIRAFYLDKFKDYQYLYRKMNRDIEFLREHRSMSEVLKDSMRSDYKKVKKELSKKYIIEYYLMIGSGPIYKYILKIFDRFVRENI